MRFPERNRASISHVPTPGPLAPVGRAGTTKNVSDLYRLLSKCLFEGECMGNDLVAASKGHNTGLPGQACSRQAQGSSYACYSFDINSAVTSLTLGAPSSVMYLTLPSFSARSLK